MLARNKYQSFSRYNQDIGEIKSRISDLERGQETEVRDLGPLVTRPPVLGDLSVTSQGSRDSVVDDEVDTVANVTQTNKQLDETTVIPTQVSLLTV